MSQKFGLSEKIELKLLRYWRNEQKYSFVPTELKTKVTSQQAVDLFSHYTDLGNFQKEIENRINYLEQKLQKQREKGFFYLFGKHFKEGLAKSLAWFLLGIILGYLLGKNLAFS